MKEDAEYETHMWDVDRRMKAGERLTWSQDDDWTEWKSVSLGLPFPKERRSKRKGKKRRRKKLPSPLLLALLALSRQGRLRLWRRDRSPWSSRDLMISTATVASTLACTVPASVSTHTVEEYVC